MKLKLKLYLALVYTLFIFFAFFLYVNYFDGVQMEEVIFFIVVLFITHNISMFFNSMSDIVISINLPILIPVIILLGPFWSALISFFGFIELQFRKNNFIWYKSLFNMTMFFITAGSASLVFKLSRSYLNSHDLIIPILLATIVYFIINNTFVFIVIKLSSEEKNHVHLYYFVELTKNLITSYFLGLLFYYSYMKYGKVFFILAIILIYIIKDFLFSRLQHLNTFTQIVEGFLKVIDSKDDYTEGHCERVAHYTFIICQELGLARSKIERIVNMAKIHDIGKIYIDDKILKSSERLSREDYEQMKRHSNYGYELLSDIDILKQDLSIILHHHEWYNGQGYPDGKRGEDIPLGARILGVCDAFDVMTTGRIYKPAMSMKEVIQELKTFAGKQFDPDISGVMVDLIMKGKFDDSFKDDLEESVVNINFN